MPLKKKKKIDNNIVLDKLQMRRESVSDNRKQDKTHRQMEKKEQQRKEAKM